LARILSIDYGLKRTGLAVTDPLQIIANSVGTVESPTLMQFLKDYFKKEVVEKVIIGLPRQMNNQPSQSAGIIQQFVNAFIKEFPNIPIEYVDERFTSKMAVQAMVQGGVKKKDRQNKALIDSISATIILQSYLESLKYKL
jgi:putative Holliday junction resolvase